MEKAATKEPLVGETRTRSVEEQNPSGSDPHPLLRLKNSVGNQAAQRLLQGRILQANATQGTGTQR